MVETIDLSSAYARLKNMPVQSRMSYASQNKKTITELVNQLTPTEMSSLFPGVSGPQLLQSISYSPTGEPQNYFGTQESTKLYSNDTSGNYSLKNLSKSKTENITLTYDAFKEAGFSHQQALALTAEVGRENDFSDKYMFGSHAEPGGSENVRGRENSGIFSWGDPQRRKEFLDFMKKEGFVDENGNLIADKNSLKAQAKFVKYEMEKYNDSSKKFLENPNIDKEQATQLLSSYIGWDIEGRHINAQQHLSRLDNYYRQTDMLVNERETTRQNLKNAKGQILVDEDQNYLAETRKKPITPELKEVLQYAAEESGVNVQVYSGGQKDINEAHSHDERVGTERHDQGHSADIRLKVQNEDGTYRVLNSDNEDDRKIMSNFIRTARKMGAVGIGHGREYMGPSGIHVGTVVREDINYDEKDYGAPSGEEAVWQSPLWVEESFKRGAEESTNFKMDEYRKEREKRIADLNQNKNEQVAKVEQISERLDEQKQEKPEPIIKEPIKPRTESFYQGGDLTVNEEMYISNKKGDLIATMGENGMTNGERMSYDPKKRTAEITPSSRINSSYLMQKLEDTERKEKLNTVKTIDEGAKKKDYKISTPIHQQPRVLATDMMYEPSPSIERTFNKTKFNDDHFSIGSINETV